MAPQAVELDQPTRASFLVQHTSPAWAQVVEFAPGQGELNLTTRLQEIATRRHRLYLIRCILRLHAQHYHLRIAGLLPARNKMVWYRRGPNPPGYRLASIPGFLQRATASLHDNTIVRPLFSSGDDSFLSLSGIIITGNTEEQRYLLHEHLVNLGLAGPPAPILQWAGHLCEGPEGCFALPFRSLVVLPAELLAIPIPSTSWAFEGMPVMSLLEWEEYRHRLTSSVLLTTPDCQQKCPLSRVAGFFQPFLPTLLVLWHLAQALLVLCDQWLDSCSHFLRLCPERPPVLPLANQPYWHLPVQNTALDPLGIQSDTHSSSTELRGSPLQEREGNADWWNLLFRFFLRRQDVVCIHGTAACTYVYRPAVVIRGCSPRGFFALPQPR